MSRFPNPILIALLLALPAAAAAPRKVPLQTYTTLWTQSPFTVKPVIEAEDREEENPFEDWALGGVSGFGGRQLVVLFHRKEANRQMIVDSGDPKAEFKVIEVRQDPDDYKKTEVVISGSGRIGTVTYDDKLMGSRRVLNVRAAAAKRPVPGATDAQQPRMRVIPQPKKK